MLKKLLICITTILLSFFIFRKVYKKKAIEDDTNIINLNSVQIDNDNFDFPVIFENSYILKKSFNREDKENILFMAGDKTVYSIDDGHVLFIDSLNEKHIVFIIHNDHISSYYGLTELDVSLNETVERNQVLGHCKKPFYFSLYKLKDNKYILTNFLKEEF